MCQHLDQIKVLPQCIMIQQEIFPPECKIKIVKKILHLHILSDGLVAYSMPQGEKRGAELDLFDFTHDGTLEEGYLKDGLGQLVDGEEGQSNFRLDPKDTGHKG